MVAHKSVKGSPIPVKILSLFCFFGIIEFMKKNKVRMAKLVRLGEQSTKGIDREFWLRAGHEARFSAAWEMLAELSAMRGGDGSKPGFKRAVQNIKRSRR